MYQFGECYLVYNVNVCILLDMLKRILWIFKDTLIHIKGHFMSQEEKLPKILIVEDDERLARLTQEYLIRNGLEVGVEPDGNRAIRRIIAEQPDMVVLDVMLPGADGLTICREVRPHYHQPILMLTARTEDMDQVLGLEMGADDYVAKPVQPRVLLARIRALLRRTDKTPEDEVAQRIEFDDLVIDNGGRSVTLNGELVDFTSAEYDLLWLLASNAGRILSREDIFERLRGIEYDGQDRSIDVRISRIRPKIGDDPENPKRIKTVRSKGYLFVKETNGL
ncbi:Transcriptional regulatory protein RstA [compost metagenome]|jgi:two-component system response regulator RstA